MYRRIRNKHPNPISQLRASLIRSCVTGIRVIHIPPLMIKECRTTSTKPTAALISGSLGIKHFPIHRDKMPLARFNHYRRKGAWGIPNSEFAICYISFPDTISIYPDHGPSLKHKRNTRRRNTCSVNFNSHRRFHIDKIGFLGGMQV